jgi:hypothetical protein
VLHWSELEWVSGQLKVISANTAAPTAGYRAAAIVRHGLVAGVAADRIEWLRPGRGFARKGETRIEVPRAVACFVSQPTGELLVVSADGTIEPVPLPT